jgi:hypothetical protein
VEFVSVFCPPLSRSHISFPQRNSIKSGSRFDMTCRGDHFGLYLFTVNPNFHMKVKCTLTFFSNYLSSNKLAHISLYILV